MRIAVCDDEVLELDKLCALLSAYDKALRPDRYLAAGALREKAGQYDVVFLDIEMEAPNGYEIARQLLNEPTHPLIVFVTHTESYAVRGYGIAFRYLLKPVTLDAMAEVMRAVESELRAYRITLMIDGGSCVLDTREILYAEVFNHTTVLHTKDGTYTFRATLRDLQFQLPARYYIAPHQSYLVNLMQARTANPQTVVMTDGTVIPVSRRKRQEFFHGLNQFLGGAPC